MESSKQSCTNPFLDQQEHDIFGGHFSLPTSEDFINPFGQPQDLFQPDLEGLSPEQLAMYKYSTGESLSDLEKKLVALELNEGNNEEEAKVDDDEQGSQKKEAQLPRQVAQGSPNPIDSFLEIMTEFPEAYDAFENDVLELTTLGLSNFLQELHFTEFNYMEWNYLFNAEFRAGISQFFELFKNKRKPIVLKEHIDLLCDKLNISDTLRTICSMTSIMETLNIRLPRIPLIQTIVQIREEIDHPMRLLFCDEQEQRCVAQRFAKTYDTAFLNEHMLTDFNGNFLDLEKITDNVDPLKCVPQNTLDYESLKDFMKLMYHGCSKERFPKFGFVLVHTNSKSNPKEIVATAIFALLEAVIGKKFYLTNMHEQTKFVITKPGEQALVDLTNQFEKMARQGQKK